MQLAFDPAQQLAAMTLTIRRSIEDHSGAIFLTLTADDGKSLGADRIAWRKPHDLSGLPSYARATVDAFMWQPPAGVLLAHRVAFREHVDALDLDSVGQLVRLGTPVPIKRRRSGQP